MTIDVAGLDKTTGRMIAWLRDRGRDGWWVIVCPSKDGRAYGNHYVEEGPFTSTQARSRISEIKKDLIALGWAEGP